LEGDLRERAAPELPAYFVLQQGAVIYLARSLASSFLAQMDILKAKLRAGLIIKEYVPSFADRPNTYAGATGCEMPSNSGVRGIHSNHHPTDFKEKFRAYHVPALSSFSKNPFDLLHCRKERRPSRGAFSTMKPPLS
jgi:hypothetical protein